MFIVHRSSFIAHRSNVLHPSSLIVPMSFILHRSSFQCSFFLYPFSFCIPAYCFFFSFIIFPLSFFLQVAYCLLPTAYFFFSILPRSPLFTFSFVFLHSKFIISFAFHSKFNIQNSTFLIPFPFFLFTLSFLPPPSSLFIFGIICFIYPSELSLYPSQRIFICLHYLFNLLPIPFLPIIPYSTD